MTGQVALTTELARDEADVDRTGVDIDAAVTSLVHEHARFVYRVTYAIVRNHHDAEDATQETFLRVMRHRHELSQVGDPRAWLARIAWRIAVDRRRKQPADPLSASEAGEVLEQVRAAGTGAEDLVISGQMLALAQQLIQQLPRDLRDVVLLSTVQEMTGAEVAAVLGIPEASVRTRLYRARQLLKEKFSALLARHEDKTRREEKKS